MYKKALEAKEKKYGPNDWEVAHSAWLAAMHYNVTGNYKEAESYYKKAVAIYEKNQGHKRSGIIQCLEDLSILYKKMDKNDEVKRIEKQLNEEKLKYENFKSKNK